jgi:hypothetical protein
MTPAKSTLILPILIITLGVGWLLTTLGVQPKINWVWTFGLVVIGLLTFALNGLNKMTVVIGPLMIVAGCLSLLRQTGRLTVDVEIPILVIVIGVLLLIARSSVIAAPHWMTEDDPTKPSRPTH